ncbi:MAG: NYN domain-containing protein [Planctomycetota bacterium]|jgi:predicted RNA-binding protein with PIN domain
MPFIIDGYNLLHSIHQTSEDWEAVGDIRLCHILGRYFQLIRENGCIVFDGKGPPEKSRFENIDRLEVLFTGLATDADTVIENKIQSDSAPKGLTIVSSDRRIRRAAALRKATAVKSDAFWQALRSQMSQKQKGKTEPAAKRKGLNQSETKQWMKYFGIEE